MTEAELREQICLIGQQMHCNGYVDGAGGNISARLDSKHILTTPSGVAKGFMTPDQIIVVDMDGKRVEANTHPHLRPTSEIIMHLECYRQRPDIQGVVHAHPPTTIALSIAGLSFTELMMPEVVILLGIVPTLPYATPASDENRNAIRESIQQHDTLVLAYHGSLTVAKNVWEAYLRLENLEHTAKILYMVKQLGGAKSFISDEQIEHLIAIRERLGLLRPGERETVMRVSH